jgi:hypothetical protein
MELLSGDFNKHFGIFGGGEKNNGGIRLNFASIAITYHLAHFLDQSFTHAGFSHNTSSSRLLDGLPYSRARM